MTENQTENSAEHPSQVKSYEVKPEMIMSAIDARPAIESFKSFIDRSYVSWMRLYYSKFSK